MIVCQKKGKFDVNGCLVKMFVYIKVKFSKENIDLN